MDLIEGISNEVLVAFILTILLIVVAVFYTFFSETERTGRSSRQNVDRNINNQNIDGGGDQSQHSTVEDQPERNPSASFTENTTARDVVDETEISEIQDPEDLAGQSEIHNVRENVRRRMVNSPDLRQDQSTGRQDETMVVKVKHNENIQTFNVARNVTVIELKRLAFSDELDAGRRVRFVYAGQLLRNDNDPITSYGVLPNTVVHCVITDPPDPATTPPTEYHEEDLDLSRLLIPLLTVALILAWYGLISYKHIFTGSSIIILMFLTSLYVILIYVTTIQ